MRLSWDGLTDRLFKIGVDRGVLYLETTDGYLPGVAWNGLTSVSDESSGHDKNFFYSGGYRADVRFTPYEHGGSIEAFFYPDEFDLCLGNIETVAGLYATGQDGYSFGLCYRTMIGDAVIGNKRGYELHIIYGAYVTKSEIKNDTISSDGAPEPMSFSYESIPIVFSDMEPTAHIVISSLRANAEKLASVEEILYGSDDAEPRILLPDELYELMYDPNDIVVPDWYNEYPYASRLPSNTSHPGKEE